MTFATNARRRIVGLDDARPLPRLGLVGCEYYATDTRITYVCISSTAWGVLVGGAVEADLATWGTIGARSNSRGWCAPYGKGTNGVPPSIAEGYTMVLGFYPTANPTAAEILLDNRDAGNTRGYYMQCGQNAGDRGQLNFGSYPGGAHQAIEPTGCTFTGALNVLHIIAMTIPTAGGSPYSLRYSFDGGVVAATVLNAGALTQRQAGDKISFGMGHTGTSPFVSGRDCLLQSYLGVATDAQLVALSGAAVRASGRPAIVPAGGGLTCQFAWRGAWVPLGAVSCRLAISGEQMAKTYSSISYVYNEYTKFAL